MRDLADRKADLSDWLKTLPLYPLPHHAISRVVLRATRWRTGWWKALLIRLFIRAFRVDMSEALDPDPGHYASFNAFFTRPLRPGARPLSEDEGEIVSPADGTVSRIGDLTGNRLVQAKGRDYTSLELLGGDAALADRFRSGHFATVYLSPRDYHRVHMPASGRLRRMIHVPGRLFSVAPHTVRAVPELFARNERVVAVFDTAHGPMAVILVGAICVASIETAWAGVVTPPRGRRVSATAYGDDGPVFRRGDEIGRFNMGSTVIAMFTSGRACWLDTLETGGKVRMGQAIGRLQTPRQEAPPQGRLD